MTLQEVMSHHTGMPAAVEPLQGLVFIENKECALRVCADYRVLNTLTHKDAAACCGCWTVCPSVSKLGLHSGYCAADPHEYA